MSNWPHLHDPNLQTQQNHPNDKRSNAFDSMTAIGGQPMQTAPFHPNLPHNSFEWIDPPLHNPPSVYPTPAPYHVGTPTPHMTTYSVGPSPITMTTPQSLDGPLWPPMILQPLDFMGSQDMVPYPVTQHDSLQMAPQSTMMSRRLSTAQIPPALILHSSSSNSNSVPSFGDAIGLTGDISNRECSPLTSYDELSPDKPDWLGDGDAAKRDLFLARNRQAATRCRIKKKEWQSNLQARAESMNIHKQALENEAFQLRNELVYLKNICLRHTDCDCRDLRRYIQQAVSQQRPVSSLYVESESSSHEPRSPRGFNRQGQGRRFAQSRPDGGGTSSHYSAQLDHSEDGVEAKAEDEDEFDRYEGEADDDYGGADETQPDIHEVTETQNYISGISKKKRRRNNAT